MNDKSEIILKEIHRLEDLVAIGNDERGKDVQEFQNLALDIKSAISILEEIRKTVNRIPAQVKNDVADVTEPVVGALQEQTAQIKDTKTVIFSEPKKGWFRRFLDEFRREVKK